VARPMASARVQASRRFDIDQPLIKSRLVFVASEDPRLPNGSPRTATSETEICGQRL
jgi:hypothetical protein